MSNIDITISNKSLPPTIDFKAGLLMLIDKPKGWTSFDVVNKVRFAVRHKLGVKKIKVGHAGTLDPLATGLLLVCIGKYTKLIDQLQGMDKSYTGTIKLGATTPSYDAETNEDEQFSIDHITKEMIAENLNSLIGSQMQTPPIYSAIKVDGERLYKKARKGQTVEIKKRPVKIHELKMESYDPPLLDIFCLVSKGTYIRSIAFDVGKGLKSGGYLTALRRTTVGEYHTDNALTMDETIKWINDVVLTQEKD